MNLVYNKIKMLQSTIQVRENPNFQQFDEINFYGDENPYIIVKNLSNILTNILNVQDYRPPNMIRNEYVDVDHLAFIGNLVMKLIKDNYKIDKSNINNIDVNYIEENKKLIYNLEKINERKEYYKAEYNKLIEEFEDYKNNDNNERYMDVKEDFEYDIETDDKYLSLKKENQDIKREMEKIKNEYEEKYKNYYSSIFETKLKEMEAKFSNIYTKNDKPNTKEKPEIKEKISTTRTNRKETHRFEDKTIPILKRCGVTTIDSMNYQYNDRSKEIIEFLFSEYKVKVKFNSIVTEKVYKIDGDAWEDVYKFKVTNGDLKDNKENKKNFKYKFIRCKELYDLYGENLDKFRIYTNYIGKCTKKEWEEYLIEFDKLYKETYKNMNKCEHKFNNGKICGKYNCKINHRNQK